MLSLVLNNIPTFLAIVNHFYEVPPAPLTIDNLNIDHFQVFRYISHSASPKKSP